MAFNDLKQALSTTLFLQLLDFYKPFMMDYGALGSGFGAVLHHGGGVMAFFSQPFMVCHLKLATYEHELIRLV